MELIERVKGSGGRVYRMREPERVFCLTGSPALAQKLLALGASSFMPPGLPERDKDMMGRTVPPGGYLRAREGSLEWDLWIHRIPVDGEQTVWEAVG